MKTKGQPRLRLTAVLRSSSNEVQGHVEKTETPVLVHRMETVNSFATEPAGFFKGKKSTYQEIPKSLSGPLSRENHPSLIHLNPSVSCGAPQRVKPWKPPKCPFTDKWIWKMGYIHAMDDDSARSTKKIMPVLPH